MWALEGIFRPNFQNVCPGITSKIEIKDEVYWGQMEVVFGKSILFCRDKLDLSLEFLESKTFLV